MTAILAGGSNIKVYLAGPMSGYPDHNFPEFDRVTAELRALGYEVISPAEVNREMGLDGTQTEQATGAITKERYAKCMRADIEALLTVDGVVLLKGWQYSVGARFEVHLARLLGLPCVEFDGWILIQRDIRTVCDPL